MGVRLEKKVLLHSILQLKKIWEKEWDESQILEEINLLRFEQGMSLDNPSNLPGLDGQVIDPIKNTRG